MIVAREGAMGWKERWALFIVMTPQARRNLLRFISPLVRIPPLACYVLAQAIVKVLPFHL